MGKTIQAISLILASKYLGENRDHKLSENVTKPCGNPKPLNLASPNSNPQKKIIISPNWSESVLSKSSQDLIKSGNLGTPERKGDVEILGNSENLAEFQNVEKTQNFGITSGSEPLINPQSFGEEIENGGDSGKSKVLEDVVSKPIGFLKLEDLKMGENVENFPKLESTLVICPVVAVFQWKQEIEKFTQKGSLKVGKLGEFGGKRGVFRGKIVLEMTNF